MNVQKWLDYIFLDVTIQTICIIKTFEDVLHAADMIVMPVGDNDVAYRGLFIGQHRFQMFNVLRLFWFPGIA